MTLAALLHRSLKRRHSRRQALDALSQQVDMLNKSLAQVRKSRHLDQQHAHRVLALRLKVAQLNLRLSELGLNLGNPVSHDGSCSSVGGTSEGRRGGIAPGPAAPGGGAS